MISAKDLVTRDQEVGPGPSVLVTSLPNARVLEVILAVDLLDDVYVAKWCVVHGKRYEKNIVVVTGKTDDLDPFFQRIVYVICMDNGIQLVTEPFCIVKFDRHTQCYVVQQPAKVGLWSMNCVENLLDYQPYHSQVI